jgi:hypothetical protein
MGLASVIPEVRQACTHLIATEGLTEKIRAAPRAETPLSTASRTRTRKSFE